MKNIMLERKNVGDSLDKYCNLLAERFIHFYNVIDSKRDTELTQDYITALLDSEIRSARMLYSLESLSSSFNEISKDKVLQLRNIILSIPLDIRLRLFDYFIENGPEETLKLWAHIEGDLD